MLTDRTGFYSSDEVCFKCLHKTFDPELRIECLFAHLDSADNLNPHLLAQQTPPLLSHRCLLNEHQCLMGCEV